jgi:hypothetical protein
LFTAELVLVNPVREQLPSPGDDAEDEQPAAAAAAAAAQQQQQGQDTAIDITALAGLTALRLLQIDLKPQPQQPDQDLNPIPYSIPLPLRFSAAGVQQLAAVWTNLVTMDLSGFGPQLLPAEAVVGFSAFKTLKHLTIVSAEGVLGAGVQQQQQHGVVQTPARRKVAWWQLPIGLASLCLSHFDLAGSIDSSSSSSEQPCCCSSSSCCCMAHLPQDLRQQQQQWQYSPTGFSSRVQQFISTGSSPLKTLAKRRQAQQNQHQQQQQQQLAGLDAAAAAAPRQQSSSPTSSSSSSDAADGSSTAAAGAEVTAAMVAAAAASSKAAAEVPAVLPQLPQVCACVAR